MVKEPKSYPPPLLSDSTEMSTDEYNNVSTQLKQVAQLLNKNDQHHSDVPSTDSEVFWGKPKIRSDKDTDQTHSADSDSKLAK